VWMRYHVEVYYDTLWLTGSWFSQANVEDVLKAVWHWCGDSSVVNNHLVEPGRTPFYVGLPPRGAPWTVTVCFLPISWESSLNGYSER
jgi:hypothetical protein